MDLTNHLVYDRDSGSFISSKLQRLAEIIQDYDPSLELRWIPPNMRTSEDSKPYVIIHNLGNGRSYSVMHFDDLTEPEQVLARIFEGDNRQGNVLASVEANNAAIEAFRLKERMDQAEEAKDMTAFLLDPARSNNYVNWKSPATGEKVKLNEYRKRV